MGCRIAFPVAYGRLPRESGGALRQTLGGQRGGAARARGDLPRPAAHLGLAPGEAGAPLTVVAQALGHADTRMVEKHYGHLAPSYVRDVIRATALGIGAGEPRPSPPPRAARGDGRLP